MAQLIVNGLTTGAVIALAAIGLSLVYGLLHIANFAHGEYLTIGAYVAFAINVTLGISLVAATLVAIAGTAVVALVLELAIWRPLRSRGASTTGLMIASVGLAFVLRNVVSLIWGNGSRRYDVNVFQVYKVGSLRISQTQLIVIAVTFVVIVLVALLLARSQSGKRMRALADNEALASVAGIDIDRTVRNTWIAAGALTGLAGVLEGLLQASFTPLMGFSLLLAIFAAVVLGGIGSAYGALLGGLGIGLAMELSTWDGFAGGVDPAYKPVVALTLLIAALLIRPQGLLGTGPAR